MIEMKTLAWRTTMLWFIAIVGCGEGAANLQEAPLPIVKAASLGLDVARVARLISSIIGKTDLSESDEEEVPIILRVGTSDTDPTDLSTMKLSLPDGRKRLPTPLRQDNIKLRDN